MKNTPLDLLKNVLKKIAMLEEGSSIIIVVSSISVLLAFAALAVDTGLLYLNTAKLQTAIDAGVLAGASELPDTQAALETARQYIEYNGFAAQDIDISFSNNDTVIRAVSNKEMDSLFSKTLGFDKLFFNAKASAQKTNESLGGPFAYRIFSGDPWYELQLGGNSFYIDGSVHANGSFRTTNSGVITKAADACNGVNLHWNTKIGGTNQIPPYVGSVNSDAEFIEMVDFSGVVNQNMPGPDMYDTILNQGSYSTYAFINNTKITRSCTINNQATINGNLYVDGDFSVGGNAPALILNGNLYVNGAVTFSNSVKINGCVFAKGDINFRGGLVSATESSYSCIYSENGNIEFTTTQTRVNGVVYAPNGNIRINGDAITIYGSLIAKSFTGLPGRLNVYSPSQDFPFMSGGGSSKLRLIE